MESKKVTIITGIFSILLFIWFVYIDAFERMIAWSSQYEIYEIDEWILLMPVSVFFLAVLVLQKLNETRKLNQKLQNEINERKDIENNLRESEKKIIRLKKMESIGQLAGGVAHDLNNVLSGMVSYPELILLELPQESKLRKPLETIQASGNKAVAIIQDLLTVARGVAVPKTALNMNDLIIEYLGSREADKLKQYYPNIDIQTRLDANLFNINGSKVHLNKVIMNLVSNAAESNQNRGNVTIATYNRYLDVPTNRYSDISNGEYVVLTVSDDGRGISAEDRERIFEPFYTKKVMGRRGTGLGLAVVWNVVQDHDGAIDVATNQNGTTFELYFPMSRELVAGKRESVSINEYKGSGEKILVVDDVESQREISSMMLVSLGYIPKSVASGEEAIDYLKSHDADLILLDMIMDPGLNGRETYERIIQNRPGQKAIIVSGFSHTDEVEKVRALGAGQYIKKPFTLEKIGMAIKAELRE